MKVSFRVSPLVYKISRFSYRFQAFLDRCNVIMDKTNLSNLHDNTIVIEIHLVVDVFARTTGAPIVRIIT